MVVYRNFFGFIFFEGGSGANIFFNDYAAVSEIVQNVFLSLCVAFGDSMIVCWLRFILREMFAHVCARSIGYGWFGRIYGLLYRR